MKEKVIFREGLLKKKGDGHVLVGNRCKSCGTTYFPKEPVCLHCLSKSLEDIELSGHGTLYTYSVIYRKVNQYDTPHVVGVINMPECVRVYAPLAIDDINSRPKGNELAIGTEMEMIVDTLWADGEKEYIGYKFKEIK